MRWGLPILVLALVLQGPAGADVPGTPRVQAPLPFDHATHGRAFDRAGVTCVDCHPVGLRLHNEQGGYTAPLVDPQPPLSSCHGCHRGELPGSAGRAPDQCMLCHADREGLIPSSHAYDWVDVHGPDARARGAECAACHEPDTCVDCHESRGALERSPHPPGFRAFHGVEAHLDPMSCSTCHTAEKCSSCHATGATPW